LCTMLLFARVAGAEVGPFAGSGSTKMSNVGKLQTLRIST